MSSDPMSSLLQRPEWFEAFTKQELEGKWKPIPNFEWTIGFFVALTVVMLPLGGGVFYSATQNLNYSARYDNHEVAKKVDEIFMDSLFAGTQQFEITIEVREKMESPVYVYYELKDFYQNHKRYVRSVEFEQIGKGNISASDLSVCKPYRLIPGNGSTDESTTECVLISITEHFMYVLIGVINPCGLLAHSYFNDTFKLQSSWTSDVADLGLKMKETGIATEWDRKYLYGDHEAKNFNEDVNTRGGGQIEGPLNEDEHFMVWMKVGSRPTVRKLYGIIESDIPKGAHLTFEIQNRYNTYDFSGEKRLILSTANWTGGRDIFTGILFFVIGGMSALACLVILFVDRRVNREAGDIRALSWERKKN
eukprot:g6954.t3